MDRSNLGTERTNAILMIGFLACFILAGCQGSILSSKGRVVPPGDRIVLSEGHHSENWSTRDLTVYYQYDYSKGQLTISGQVIFADYVQSIYITLDYFNIGMLVLDEKGVVLESKGLTTSNALSPTQQPLKFKSTLVLPAGTASIAFYYTGQARSTGQNGAVDSPIWYFPYR